MPTRARQRRLARWLSVSTFVVNLTIIGAILLGSVMALRTLYDPYNLDEHVLTPVILWMNGWTELHLAAARGDTEEVARLIAEGADVHAATGKGRTALFEGAKRGHHDIVDVLIDHGARIDATDEAGKTPLMESIEHGHDLVVQVLVQRGAQVDLHEPTQGNTALHVAAQRNQYWAARHLLAGGAAVDSRNANRETALHVAARQSWHENGSVAALLIESHTDLEARDNQGFTPLIRAAQNGHLPVLSALMTRRADPNAKSHQGWSALYLAAKAGHTRIAKILLARGADPNARCDCSSTPLHQGVRSGNERVVALLLERGAEVNAKVRGKTALQLAEERNLHAISQLLRDHGGTTYPKIFAHVSRARALKKSKDYAGAVTQYSRAIDLDPTDAELYYLRGAVRFKMLEYPRAQEDFERSLALDPSRFDAYIKVAYILSLQQDWDGIIRRWDRFLSREPHHAKALYERGRVYFRKGAYERDAPARAQAVADTLLSCQMGNDEGCKTYTDTTGKPAA